ncbi:MAG: hypothetical protein ABFS32_22275 [Bacteroidota bacterium]
MESKSNKKNSAGTDNNSNRSGLDDFIQKNKKQNEILKKILKNINKEK